MQIPKSYRDALDANGLKGARIGVLRALWGSAPEDDEVAAIVRKALDGFKAQGAEVVDIIVPGLDELLRESSVIGDEFKFDLAAYLAKQPNAPVKSLGEIIDRGLHHAELDATFRLRNAPEKRDTEHYRQAMIKRRALRAVVLATPRRTAHRCARLSDAAPQAGVDRRSAGRHQLSAQCDDRVAGDRPARGVHAPTACRSRSSCWAARGKKRSC